MIILLIQIELYNIKFNEIKTENWDQIFLNLAIAKTSQYHPKVSQKVKHKNSIKYK
jgi:hypothetical protein